VKLLAAGEVRESKRSERKEGRAEFEVVVVEVLLRRAKGGVSPTQTQCSRA
jgi:hypothetical protein